jgi:hypothetical protein
VKNKFKRQLQIINSYGSDTKWSEAQHIIKQAENNAYDEDNLKEAV